MLKELRVAPIIVLLLASIAFAASAFQEAPWRTFTSAEGKFSVLTPTEPKTEVRDVDSAVGKLTMYSYSSSSKAAYLLVSFGDYPNEPVDADHIEQVLNGVQSGVLGSIGGETISENKIVLKGRPNSGTTPVEYPGREFTGKKMGEGSEIFFSWRIYLVGRRLYQLAVITNKADANSPDVSKFLSSFELSSK